MEEDEKEIEVRSLAGESTTVTVSAGGTVNDLKLLLKLRFPPATSFPDFHIYSKGVKLGLQTQIRSLAIAPGEFLVLIPFIKKDRPQTPKPDFPTNVPEQSPISSLADSAYSDMMREFSYLSEKSSNTGEEFNCEPSNSSSGYKRRRDFECNNDGDCDYNREEGGPYGFLCGVLQSSNKDIFEKRSCEKFVEVLESLNCLANSRTGRCMLFARRGKSGTMLSKDNEDSCVCPGWLKRIMMAFAFLNIFSAFLQLRGEKIKSGRLKEAIKQLQKFGFTASFEDVEHLTILCPKIEKFCHCRWHLAQ